MWRTKKDKWTKNTQKIDSFWVVNVRKRLYEKTLSLWKIDIFYNFPK